MEIDAEFWREWIDADDTLRRILIQEITEDNIWPIVTSRILDDDAKKAAVSSNIYVLMKELHERLTTDNGGND